MGTCSRADLGVSASAALSLSLASNSSRLRTIRRTSSASSHTPVEKKMRSPASTVTSPLLAPLVQSSQKRSRPSDSADAPIVRCTHQPPPVKETAFSPSKPMNEPSLCTASTLVPALHSAGSFVSFEGEP